MDRRRVGHAGRRPEKPAGEQQRRTGGAGERGADRKNRFLAPAAEWGGDLHRLRAPSDRGLGAAADRVPGGIEPNGAPSDQADGRGHAGINGGAAPQSNRYEHSDGARGAAAACSCGVRVKAVRQPVGQADQTDDPAGVRDAGRRCDLPCGRCAAHRRRDRGAGVLHRGNGRQASPVHSREFGDDRGKGAHQHGAVTRDAYPVRHDAERVPEVHESGGVQHRRADAPGEGGRRRLL